MVTDRKARRYRLELVFGEALGAGVLVVIDALREVLAHVLIRYGSAFVSAGCRGSARHGARGRSNRAGLGGPAFNQLRYHEKQVADFLPARKPKWLQHAAVVIVTLRVVVPAGAGGECLCTPPRPVWPLKRPAGTHETLENTI